MSKTRDTGFLNNVVKTDSQGNVFFVSGSTTLLSISSSGAVTTTGVISGSNALSASYAQNSELLDNLDSTSFVFTSSYNTDSSSVSTRVTRIEGNYATTGSNVFLGAQTVCANITSTGTIIAQTLNVQQVTSSIVYSSGSNVFGNLLTDTQQMTGSVTMTGSLNVAGNTCVTSICSPSIVGGVVSGTTLCTSNGVIGNNSNNLYLSSNSTTGEISFWANQLNTRLMTITSCGCVGIGTNTPSSTYGRLTVAGTGISIVDDGNAKLQIGRFNSANCNAYIKMGINTCSLRFTNPGDTVDVVTFDKGGNVMIGKTTNAGGKLQVSNGTTTFNVDHNADGPYLTGATDNNVNYRRLSYDATEHVFLISATERMRITSVGATCFSCPISITGAGSGTALNFGNSVANNILYINSYGGWSGIGMDVTSATMRIAGDITEPNGIVQFGYYKGGTLNNACWCQKAVILTTGIGCFANVVCAPTFRGGSSIQLSSYTYQFTANKSFLENTTDVEFFKIGLSTGVAGIFVQLASNNGGTATYKMQTYHGILSNDYTGWVGCGTEITGTPSCRASFGVSCITSVAVYTQCIVFRVSTTNNGSGTNTNTSAAITVVTQGSVPTFTQL